MEVLFVREKRVHEEALRSEECKCILLGKSVWRNRARLVSGRNVKNQQMCVGGKKSKNRKTT